MPWGRGCDKVGEKRAGEFFRAGSRCPHFALLLLQLLFLVFSFRKKRIRPCFHVVLIEIHPQALK